MPRPLNYPILRGIRLTVDDDRKLEALCTAAELSPADTVRLLIRTACPGDVAFPQLAASTASGDYHD